MPYFVFVIIATFNNLFYRSDAMRTFYYLLPINARVNLNRDRHDQQPSIGQLHWLCSFE